MTPNRMALQASSPFAALNASVPAAPSSSGAKRVRSFPKGGQIPASSSSTNGISNRSHASFDLARTAHVEANGRDDDLLIGLQLTHSGRYSFARPILAQHDPLLDPRTIVDKHNGSNRWARLPADFRFGARLTTRPLRGRGRAGGACGFRFRRLKAMPSLPPERAALGPAAPGKYGGSFENRTRFIREVAARIRENSPRLILATRLNVFDGLPYANGPDGFGVPCAFDPPVQTAWGTDPLDPFRPDLDEPLQLIEILIELGVSLVNVSLGNPYASPHLLRPFENPPPDGYETPEHPLLGVARHFACTALVQKRFPSLTVVGSGYSWLQEFAFRVGAANVVDGRAGFVGIGRGALSQPDFARSLAEGRPLDPRRLCRTFSFCTALMRSKHNALGQFATGCPPFDKDVYGPIWEEANAKATRERPRPS